MRKLLFVLVGLVLASAPALAVTLEWVQVRNPGNAPDVASNCLGPNCGEVDYTFYLSKYAITNSQYAEFLNVVDPNGSNTLALYNPSMSTDTNNGGISLVPGNPSGSKYVVNAGFADKPVVYVSFYDALRFMNWFGNGQGSGSTETGPYTLLGGTPEPSNGATVTRNPGALTFLPSENEWYKAAYFNGTSYLTYPKGTNTQPVCAMPGATPNTANCNFVVGQVTDVDAYPGSPSPYGTFDQGGNIFEWNDQIAPPSSLWVAPRERRGGSFNLDASTLASSRLLWLSASIEISDIGFRVATLAPDPVCGDGVVEGSERCDDGNTLNGDGCSSSCQVESGWTCNADSPTNCTTSLRDQGNTILDTSNNLEWLKFSQTEGESYNQVVAGFLTANPGWAYATVAQVCTLTTDPQACAANPGTSYKPRGGAVALLTSGSTALQAITGLSNPDGSQGVGLLTTQVNETFLTPSSTEMTLGASQPGVASFLVLQVQGCGIGPELGMVAPLLIWLRARRRRFPE